MKTKTSERLFPELPENLSEVTDSDISSLLREHEAAADLINREDEEFCDGFTAEELLSELEIGAEQVQAINDEIARREEGQAEFLRRKAELAGKIIKTEPEEDPSEDPAPEDPEAALAADETDPEAKAEGEVEGDEKTEPEVEEDPEPKAELAETRKATPLRRPPSPSAERRAAVAAVGTPLLAASGLQEVRAGKVLDRKSLAQAVKTTAERKGRPSKSASGVEERILVASAQFPFPADRQLRTGDIDGNAEKIAAVIPFGSMPGVGRLMGEALVASGGFCAPLEPIYTMPNFASQSRPVRASLPSFQADRGGVTVPAASYIGDIDTAITVITADEDELGGTFATKSCQDLDCPVFTDVAVTIVSHCREYGNLNAMAWPEKIAHENDLTMAAHARTAETYLLERIKAQSLFVTQAALGTTMNAYASFVHAVEKATAAIRFRLRMEPDARFRVLAPAWFPDLLVADAALAQFDRYQAEAMLTAKLAQLGIGITWHLDNVAGESAVSDFAAETSHSTLNDFPNTVEYAVYAEGAFMHIDSGSLELGLVRDSTLNSTNDFQLFGESFENVVLLGPAQSALWVQQTICPNGVFPALGTAPTCS